MTSINQSPSGELTAYVKGAPEETLALCTMIQTESGAVELNEETRREILKADDSFAREALRVIAVAQRTLPQAKDFAEEDLVFLGLLAMMDPPRPGVEEAVKTCARAGIQVIMITGDYGLTAESFARQVGLVKEKCRVITGAELDSINDRELSSILKSEGAIFARVNPEHKLRIVTLLKGEGKIVAVTGDGVNDAPALKKADIGIAMGLSGTDVAKEAAEMILLDDNFATIVSAIEEGRGVYDNIKKFVTYILASNVPEIIPFIAFILFKIPLPLTIMQILAVDLGTDLAPALALGSEKPEPDVMERPPRPKEKRLLDFNLLARAYGWLGLIEGAAAMLAFSLIYLSPNYVYETATTMCLAAIVTSQIGNGFACRSERNSIFSIGLFSNRLYLFGIAIELALIGLLIYFPPLAGVFGLHPLTLPHWGFLLIFAPAILFLEELRKIIFLKWYNKRKQFK